MAGIQGGSFKLIFPVLYFQASIFTADDVEFADHLVVIDQMFRIYVEGQNNSTSFISSNTFLEESFSFSIPWIFQILSEANWFYIVFVFKKSRKIFQIFVSYMTQVDIHQAGHTNQLYYSTW